MAIKACALPGLSEKVVFAWCCGRHHCSSRVCDAVGGHCRLSSLSPAHGHPAQPCRLQAKHCAPCPAPLSPPGLCTRSVGAYEAHLKATAGGQTWQYRDFHCQ